MKRITAIVTTLCLLLTVFGALNLSASAATAGWTGGWAASAGVTVNGDTVTMVSEAGEGEHTYEKGGIIAKSFDVEWTMRLDHYAGGEFLLIYTGSHRYYFHFGLETISWEYLNAGGSNAMDSISYEFGSDFHNFRLVGSDGTADFYLDGFYITTITPPTSVGSSMMRFYTRGSSGKSGITINDVTVNKFTGRGNEEEGEPTKPSLLEELQTVGWASEALPAEDVFFGFDKAEDYKDWVIRPNWTFEDGLVKHNTTTATATNYNLQLLSMYGTFGMEKGQDLIVTTKFKVNQFDEQLLINVTWPGYACRTFIFPDVVELEMSSDSSLYLASDPINLVESGNKGDGKWHEWMVKTSHGGSKMQLFMDGKPITGLMDAFQNNSWEYNGMIYLAGLANASYGWDVEFDWVDVKLIDHDIRIETPMKNAEYLEGEPIALRASLLDSVEDEIPSVDYKIDGKVVATGYAPEYRATITGLGAGNYDVVAEYEGHDSGAVSFTVREAVKGELETSLDGSGNLSANLKFYEKAPKVTKVEYYLDGACVAVLDSAPYTMTKAGITPMAHTLEAVCYDAAGIVLGEFSESVIPKIGGNTVSKNFSNDISYSVSGSGTAEINYSNGRHQLKLTHTKDGVTYLTDTGEETYKYGTGDFRILTDGAVADGYHNGQLVFSYYMPQTKAVEKKITENGMTVSDFAVSIPEERGNFLVAENVTGKSVYRLGDTSSIHAVDFVADAKDEAHIVLNDSFYRTDLTLKNGKFYGWTSKEISSEPFVEELVDAYAAEGEVYYRLETVAGMSRLFANGRWIATFRNIQSVGDHTLAVDVTEGDGLSYLAVSGLRDIYYYEDDYFGKGQFESEDYWRSHKDMSIEHDVELGRMNLTARGKTDAMAEISANLGNFDISADVRVRKDTKGFWIYYNRPTTNDYSKAGYNYQTGQFEIVDQMAGYKTVVSAPGELPWEENVHLELKVREDLNNKYVTLYVNGEPVVSQTDSPWIRGRVGFMLTDGAAYVQNFHLRGDSKPMLGVNHSVAAPGAVSFSDMAVTDEGYKFFIASTGYGFTNDLGLTWQTLWTKGGGAGISDQVTNLPNGEILTIKNMLVGNKDGKNLYNAQVSVSKDGGHNWETVGMLEDEPVPMLAASGGRLKVGRSGRVYYTPALDATENPWNHAGLYYSDDNGRTWEQGGTIRAVDIDATIVEHCVVEAEGDELHCYTRTDQGTIIKIISYDRGKTWDTDHVYKTPFLSPECCMNIQADPVKEGVFWMSWSYDNDNVHGKGQYPRTNQSLAVSTDYGKTWNFYGRPYENNSTGVPSATTNLNLDLSDDYIVINSPAENSVKKAGDKPLIIFIPKDKQVVSKRWEQVHLEYPSQVNVTKPLSYSDTDKVLAIHPESNAVLLRGMRIVDVVYDGKVSAEVLASYLGGTVEAGENGALVFKYAGTETVVSADAIAVKDGKKYVEPKAFAEAAGLYVENEKNTVIISSFKTLGVSQKEALRYGLDFFTDEV